MVEIPLPFVIALLLAVLLLRLISQQERRLLPVGLFIAACLALVTVMGLRWSFDLPGMRLVQPVVACALPPLAWVLFSDLTGPRRGLHLLPHAVPAVLVAVLPLVPGGRAAVDVVLAASYFGYGAALLRRAAAGPDGWAAVRFSDAVSANRAAFAVGGLLVGSGAIDVVIAGEFLLNQGASVGAIVGSANLVMLPVLAYAVAVAGKALPEVVEEVAEPVAGPTGGDHEVLAAVDSLIRQRGLFRDPELSLDRLARRALIPTRQISGAVNRVLGQNVSQFVNGYRVAEAKRLLLQTDLTVTAIMFEAGFQTKSNFNHEFRRVAGQSPSDFRRLGEAAAISQK